MSNSEIAKILPPATELSRPFWEGCRAGELRLQHCGDCGRFQFYPRTVCSHCDSTALTWRAVSGNGRIASFTVVRRAISFAYDAPYVVALIDLEEGPRMMSSVVGVDPEALDLEHADSRSADSKRTNSKNTNSKSTNSKNTDSETPHSEKTDSASIAIGDAVTVQFEAWGEDYRLPVFSRR